MAGLSNSLVIALWIVGSCWAVALVAYVLDVPTDFIFPMLGFGVVTGVVEWLVRRGLK